MFLFRRGASSRWDECDDEIKLYTYFQVSHWAQASFLVPLSPPSLFVNATTQAISSVLSLLSYTGSHASVSLYYNMYMIFLSVHKNPQRSHIAILDN